MPPQSLTWPGAVTQAGRTWLEGSAQPAGCWTSARAEPCAETLPSSYSGAALGPQEGWAREPAPTTLACWDRAWPGFLHSYCLPSSSWPHLGYEMEELGSRPPSSHQRLCPARSKVGGTVGTLPETKNRWPEDRCYGCADSLASVVPQASQPSRENAPTAFHGAAHPSPPWMKEVAFPPPST